MTRSQLSERLLCLDGKPISFENYPMFRAIYDGLNESMLLMTCRQVGKSTTLSNFAIAESIAIDFFKTYFISPIAEQTHKFSTLRVGKTIQYSPNVKKFYSTERTEARVNLRMFSNGSEIAFNYAKEEADRCRGYSADRLMLDEIQDMFLDAVEPVVRECLNESSYKWITRCGTPKTMENGIQDYWAASSQSEWAIKCTGCSKHNLIRSEKSIGKKGPICLHCGKCLNPRDGQWIDLKPDANIRGFHVSRLIMPKEVPAAWNTQKDVEKAEKHWADILDKFEGPRPYSISKFRNEVIGVSDSQGRRLVTRETLESACTGPAMSMKQNPQIMKDIVNVGIGVDWSGGGIDILSRTVVWVLGRRTNRQFRTLYYKIFPGTSPVDEVMEIASIINMYPAARLVGCDAGEGNMPTEMLRKRVGHQKVFKFRLGASASKCKWNPEGGFFSVNRTWSIDSLMSSLQRQEIQFDSNKDAMGPAFDDILNVFEDVTTSGYKVWRHAPTKPDDAMHGLNFARMALMMITNELDLTS